MNVLERQAEAKERLGALPLMARVVFGAACAQRMAPVCAQYFADEEEENVFGDILERVWACVLGTERLDNESLAAMYEDAADSLPEEDSLAPKAQSVVEYACTSAASALGQLIGEEPDGAADAALCIWEAIACSATGSTKTKRLKEELGRQDKDLDALANWPTLSDTEQKRLATDARRSAEANGLVYLTSVL